MELTDDMDKEAGVSADGGGDQEDGEASGPIRGDRHEHVEAALGGADHDHEPEEEGGVEEENVEEEGLEEESVEDNSVEEEGFEENV